MDDRISAPEGCAWAPSVPVAMTRGEGSRRQQTARRAGRVIDPAVAYTIGNFNPCSLAHCTAIS